MIRITFHEDDKLFTIFAKNAYVQYADFSKKTVACWLDSDSTVDIQKRFGKKQEDVAHYDVINFDNVKIEKSALGSSYLLKVSNVSCLQVHGRK